MLVPVPALHNFALHFLWRIGTVAVGGVGAIPRHFAFLFERSVYVDVPALRKFALRFFGIGTVARRGIFTVRPNLAFLFSRGVDVAVTAFGILALQLVARCNAVTGLGIKSVGGLTLLGG